MATARKAGRRRGARAKSTVRSRRIGVAKAKSVRGAKAAATPATKAAPPAAKSAGMARAKAAKPASSPAPQPRPARKREAARPAARRATADTPRPAEDVAVASLTDEERIESAKYEPRRARPRVFEEERFLFPQTYGVNRLRLLVKDPEWLFAYWDVDPRSMESLRADLGERASALSQLTLRVFEDKDGGASTFLLPQDQRTWYVQTRTPGRAYRAEVGVMLPSGEFRPLAQSNSTASPRGTPSSQKAKRTVRYDRSRPVSAETLAQSSEAMAAADLPWSPPLDAGAGPEEVPPRPAPRAGEKRVSRGGASDVHRR